MDLYDRVFLGCAATLLVAGVFLSALHIGNHALSLLQWFGVPVRGIRHRSGNPDPRLSIGEIAEAVPMTTSASPRAPDDRRALG